MYLFFLGRWRMWPRFKIEGPILSGSASCILQQEYSTPQKNEVELNLGRSACFQTPANIQEMTICPLHRERLGIGWRRSIRLCSVPEQLSGHNENSKKNAERGCNLSQSKFILEATGRFVPVGSLVYVFYTQIVCARVKQTEACRD